MKVCFDISATEARPLSRPTRVYPSWVYQTVEVGYIRLRWERVGVRGYALSLGRNPSPVMLSGARAPPSVPTSPNGRGEAGLVPMPTPPPVAARGRAGAAHRRPRSGSA